MRKPTIVTVNAFLIGVCTSLSVLGTFLCFICQHNSCHIYILPVSTQHRLPPIFSCSKTTAPRSPKASKECLYLHVLPHHPFPRASNHLYFLATPFNMRRLTVKTVRMTVKSSAWLLWPSLLVNDFCLVNVMPGIVASSVPVHTSLRFLMNTT